MFRWQIREQRIEQIAVSMVALHFVPSDCEQTMHLRLNVIFVSSCSINHHELGEAIVERIRKDADKT